MYRNRFEFTSEQTLHLKELRNVLVSALPKSAMDMATFPVINYWACRGGCIGICGSGCANGCTKACNGFCITTCSWGCGHNCVADCADFLGA